MKGHFGATAVRSVDADGRPRHGIRRTRPQNLEDGFLGGKSSGQDPGIPQPSAQFKALGFVEDRREVLVAVPIHGGLDGGVILKVNADAGPLVRAVDGAAQSVPPKAVAEIP